LDRFDAPAEVNEHYDAVEMPVRRRTHTSSVVLKAKADMTKGLLDVAPDGTIVERMGHSWRLRPRAAKLGPVPMGKNLRFRMVLSNVGVETGRFRIKQPANPDVAIVYNPGPLAPGMSTVLEVEVFPGEIGALEEELYLETESEVFSIAITASVLDAADFSAWTNRGGQLPINLKQVDVAPRRATRSVVHGVTAKKPTTGYGQYKPLRDLQDPVEEPDRPSAEMDWFVDTTKNMAQIRDMTTAQRMHARYVQAAVRSGRTIIEADEMEAPNDVVSPVAILERQPSVESPKMQ